MSFLGSVEIKEKRREMVYISRRLLFIVFIAVSHL